MENPNLLIAEIQKIVHAELDSTLKNYLRIITANVVSVNNKVATVRMPFAHDASNDFTAYIVTGQTVKAGDVVNVAYWCNLSTAIVLSNVSGV